MGGCCPSPGPVVVPWRGGNAADPGTESIQRKRINIVFYKEQKIIAQIWKLFENEEINKTVFDNTS